MTLAEKNIITERMSVIIGAKNIRLGRIVDMIWIAMKGTDGRDYALHMQTFFRFSSRGKILITDADKFQPLSPDIDYETFDWDVQGSNLLDKWCEEFNRDFSGNTVVESVEINNFGDLKICFDNSITLTVYINTTSDDECWRFFIWHGAEEHLVITGREIQCQEDNAMNKEDGN